MTNFPTSLDDSASLPNPTTTSKTNSPSHSALHSDENAAIIAVETKVGSGDTTPSDKALLVGTGAGTSAWDASPAGVTLDTPILNTPDLNGTELILDADADTSITADTDDQIDIKVAGADDFRITANTLTALSGSTIATNTIAETTAASGVTVDGLLIKDSKLATNDSVVTANITNLAVTNAKLAGSITDAKLLNGKIKSRQGGSATDWSATGSTTYAVSGEVIIQVGARVGSSSGETTVTFPTAFSQPPIVIGSQLRSSAASSFFRISSTNVTATEFIFSMISTSNTRVAEPCSWIAIGPSA